MSSAAPFASVRPAAVAGSFYPATASTLARDVERALGEAHPPSLPVPKALIVPHAGYIYSGPIAASAYRTLAEARGRIRRVVLLGPCHRVPVRGLALPDAAAFETPLGRVSIDASAASALADLPQVVCSSAAHAREHSLEVQLPFLQHVLEDFSLVPLAVGDASADEVAEVLERLWGGPETLIVVSSDLSHYLRYDDARAIDGATTQAILALDPALDHEQACGATPIAGLLTVARRRGLSAHLLDLRNSGDTAGDRSRVVGYAAFALIEPGSDLAHYRDEHGRTLLDVARGAIREALGGPPGNGRYAAAWLDERRATFVTLRQDASLRGCIGSIEPRRRLHDDVAANARAAALADPRFPPLDAGELERTTIEVSVLSAPAPLAFRNRTDLFAQLIPGIDGIVLTAGTRRSTFLPQVWEALPEPAAFIDNLLRKAGLPDDYRIEDCRFERYRVRKWAEGERDA